MAPNSAYGRSIAFLIAVYVAGPVLAADPSQLDITDSSLRSIEPTAQPLSRTDKIHAKAWGLSEGEWSRYTDLMQGVRGSLSPSTISPIEVLGIHARDEAERRRFAEQWAVIMREDAERILAFQRAYDEASRRRYPDELLIDPARLPVGPKQEAALQRDDRVLLFTQPDCPPCEAVLRRVLDKLDRFAGLDVYLSGVAAGDESAVRAWAQASGIRLHWVRNRQVTLNFAADVLEKLTGREGATLPYLMRRRGEAVSVLPPSAL